MSVDVCSKITQPGRFRISLHFQRLHGQNPQVLAGNHGKHASVSLGCKGTHTGLAIRQNHQVQLKHFSGATCEETQAETQPSQTLV